MTKKTRTISAERQNAVLHLDQKYKYLFAEIKTKIQTSRSHADKALQEASKMGILLAAELTVMTVAHDAPQPDLPPGCLHHA